MRNDIEKRQATRNRNLQNRRHTSDETQTMNRSESSKNSKSYKKKKKRKMSRGKKIALMILGILGAVFILFAARYGGLLLKYKIEAERMVDEGGRKAFTSSLSTIVYDADGEELLELSSEKTSHYLSSDDIPYMAKKIFTITEDRKFYEHKGVDFSAVFRAFVALIKNEGEITQGGSTITQQLSRNIFLTHEVSLERKIKEMFIAWKIEKEYEKDEILEFYINDIYFANGYYGLEAASRGYFQKSAMELSTAELAFVCSIPNNPTLYDPLDNMENTLKRKDRILKQLYEHDILTESDYQGALTEEIQLNPEEKKNLNYVETFVRYSATLELMKLRGFVFQNSFTSEENEAVYKELYNEEYAASNKLLFTGGYRIYTTIDSSLQQVLQDTLDENLSVSEETGEDGIYTFQGSATCIDNETGYVTAIVGGRTQEGYGYTLNRAFQSFRQPGSSIKPILVYTPLFETGYTPESMVKDEPIKNGPVNAPNVYSGTISLRYAIQTSKNTVAWHYFEELGYRNCIEYLLKMNFSKIVEEDYHNAAMSIGGMTWGVSTYEMAAAFASLENNGEYRNPTCVKRIEDSFGDLVLENGKNNANTVHVYEREAALMMTDSMKDVMTSGTGKRYRPDNAICAGKTGTTNDDKDSWLVGYSRYYTLAVWCGYDMPKEIEGNLKYAAGSTWKDFMEAVHAEKSKIDFEDYRKQEDEQTTEEESTTEDESTTEEEGTSEEITTQEETTTQQQTSEEKTTTKQQQSEEKTEDDSETESSKENQGEMEDDTTRQIETTSREIQTEEESLREQEIETTTRLYIPPA